MKSAEEWQEKDIGKREKFKIICNMFGLEVKVVNSPVFLKRREEKRNKKKGEKVGREDALWFPWNKFRWIYSGT